MKKLKNGEYEIETAGYNSVDKITFNPSRWSCGSIKDGVSLTHEPRLGGFGVSYEDLQEMAKIARDARKD